MKRWHAILGAVGGLQVDVPDDGVLDFRFGADDLVFLSGTGEERHFPSHPLLRSQCRREF